MPPSDVARIVDSYGTTAAKVRAQIVAFVTRAWSSLPDYHDPQIDRFVQAVVPVVIAGQRQVASLTDAYLARVASALNVHAPIVGIPAASLVNLRGIPALEVYRRPAVELRTALARGATFDEAVARGLTRAVSLAVTDLQLAKTHAVRHRFGLDARIVGYRRVLTGNKSCGLCAIASTQRYHRRALMPIHPGCDCAVAPIYGKHDPGRVINKQALVNVDATVAERFGAERRHVPTDDLRHLIVTHEHGELGPVLARAGDHFTRL